MDNASGNIKLSTDEAADKNLRVCKDSCQHFLGPERERRRCVRGCWVWWVIFPPFGVPKFLCAVAWYVLFSHTPNKSWRVKRCTRFVGFEAPSLRARNVNPASAHQQSRQGFHRKAPVFGLGRNLAFHRSTTKPFFVVVFAPPHRNASMSADSGWIQILQGGQEREGRINGGCFV